MIRYDDVTCREMRERALKAHSARLRRQRKRRRESRENLVVFGILLFIMLYFGGHLLYAVLSGRLP